MNIADRQGPHGQAASAVQEGRPVEAQYVRGGRRGGRTMLILLASAVLAAAALGATWALEAPRGHGAPHPAKTAAPTSPTTSN